jgi:hypothetical protein
MENLIKLPLLRGTMLERSVERVFFLGQSGRAVRTV